MLLFVVDASPELGFGHLNRCLNLARLNRSRSEVLFALKYDKTAAAVLEKNRFSYVTDFKTVNWSRQADLTVFDVCRILPEYSSLLAELSKRSLPALQINDLGLNVLPGVPVVDGSLYRYPAGATIAFSGPQYMILHHKCRHFNLGKRYYRRHINHVLLSLGGAAGYRDIRKIVDVLARQRLSCKIAPGFLLKKNQKKVLTRLYSKISWVGQTESLARSLYQSDLAVISPGVTAYEAAATGTPCLYLSHHELQERTASLFEEHGVGCNMGLIARFDSASLVDALQKLTVEQRAAMGGRGKVLVDGLGLYRVNEILKNAVII